MIYEPLINDAKIMISVKELDNIVHKYWWYNAPNYVWAAIFVFIPMHIMQNFYVVMDLLYM